MHFGLGAVAENRREWDKARAQYEAVKNDPAMPKVSTDYAALRLRVLDKISAPFVEGRPMTSPSDFGLPRTLPTTNVSPTTGPPTAPTTAPGADSSTRDRAVAPSTGPVVPTTAPATQAMIGEGHFGTKDDLFYP